MPANVEWRQEPLRCLVATSSGGNAHRSSDQKATANPTAPMPSWEAAPVEAGTFALEAVAEGPVGTGPVSATVDGMVVLKRE